VPLFPLLCIATRWAAAGVGWSFDGGTGLFPWGEQREFCERIGNVKSHDQGFGECVDGAWSRMAPGACESGAGKGLGRSECHGRRRLNAYKTRMNFDQRTGRPDCGQGKLMLSQRRRADLFLSIENMIFSVQRSLCSHKAEASLHPLVALIDPLLLSPHPPPIFGKPRIIVAWQVAVLVRALRETW
jgi:hypothetical protein